MLAGAAMASADPVTLTIQNGGNIVSGGVYVGPYNFTTSTGQSLQLICDTFQNDVNPPETWNANTTTLSNLSGTLFGNPSSSLYSAQFSIQYQEVAWLAQQMFANLSNMTTVADIQWAIWDIFDPNPTPTCNYISNCDPYLSYGPPLDTAGINTWLANAQNPSNYANGNYSNVVIYTPTSGWPGYPNNVPQEYIGIVPEPGSILLMSTGLIALFVFRRRLAFQA
jgi:hypothetical protein